MANEGWIKLHRSFLDWEWWSDINTSRLFLYCIIKANHEDKRWRGLVVKRGSFVTSYEKLAIGTGLSKKAVRTALKHLIWTHEVAQCSNSKYTIISVSNYDKYQEVGTPMGTPRANKGHTEGTPRATNKNDKNDKNEKNEKKGILENPNSKRPYGSFENVYLTSVEYQKLMEKYPDYKDKIENLAEYLESTGKHYRSHYAVILNWARKDEKESANQKGISIF